MAEEGARVQKLKDRPNAAECMHLSRIGNVDRGEDQDWRQVGIAGPDRGDSRPKIGGCVRRVALLGIQRDAHCAAIPLLWTRFPLRTPTFDTP
jgi:hypothetical protein